MDYSNFIDYFPEFESIDESIVSASIRNTVIECNGYAGINTLSVREYAIALHSAHNLTIEQHIQSGQPYPIKSVASKNDKIEYAVGKSGYELGTTIYGTRLQALIDSNYLGGFNV